MASLVIFSWLWQTQDQRSFHNVTTQKFKAFVKVKT